MVIHVLEKGSYGHVLWTVDPLHGESLLEEKMPCVCIYHIGIPDIEDSCGPQRRFTSSHTEESSGITNSSLSVTLTDDLNGTLVECIDATVACGDIIASYNICVIGT